MAKMNIHYPKPDVSMTIDYIWTTLNVFVDISAVVKKCINQQYVCTITSALFIF